MTRLQSMGGIQDRQLRTLLSTLDDNARRVRGTRRQLRDNARRPLRGPIRIRFLARDGVTPLECNGVTRDISRTGIGFLCNKRLPNNAQIRMVVRGPDDRVFHLSGTIIHTRPLSDDWSHVGASFRQVKSARLAPFPDDIELPSLGEAIPQ